MKTTKTYKADGHTFNSMDEVVEYADKNVYVVEKTESFMYKGKTIVCVDLKSK